MTQLGALIKIQIECGKVIFNVSHPVFCVKLGARSVKEVKDFCNLYNLAYDRDTLMEVLSMMIHDIGGGWTIPEELNSASFIQSLDESL